MILIVDDEEAITDSLTTFFKKKELEVIGFYKVEEALTIIEEGTVPEILLTDYHLPDGSGLDIISMVKAKNPKCQCFLLTGKAEKSEEEFKRLGVDFIVLKPFTKKEIFERVKEFLKS